MTLQAESSSRPVDEATLATPPPPSLPPPLLHHTHQYTVHFCNIRLHYPRRPFLNSLTPTLDPPRSWCATEKQHSFCRRPQTQPARAHHHYAHEPRQASIPLIPCLLRSEGHRPGLANIAARADIPDTLYGHGCTGHCASQ
jgi:hypothetical protein